MYGAAGRCEVQNGSEGNRMTTPAELRQLAAEARERCKTIDEEVGDCIVGLYLGRFGVVTPSAKVDDIQAALLQRAAEMEDLAGLKEQST